MESSTTRSGIFAAQFFDKARNFLFPFLRRWPNALAALVAVVLAIALRGLPHNLGLILAALGGIAAGVAWTEVRR